MSINLGPTPLARNVIPFSLDDTASLDVAVDRLLEMLGGERVQMLALGEPTHGIEEPLALRNAMFRRLVQRHGFTAIAIESSFPRSMLVNQFVNGHAEDGLAQVREAGFSHGFGRLSTSRELVEWMRQYNASASAQRRLHFFGFDGPMEMMHTDSPRQSIALALDALAKLDPTVADGLRERIEPLLGDDAAWANERANMDPGESIGDSPLARSLRAEVERLVRAADAPEYEIADAQDRLDARHFAAAADGLLKYHHAVATLPREQRLSGMLSLRDAMMGEHLHYILTRERLRGGRVFVFAHNSHVQRGVARWQWGPNLLEWRPAGFHAAERFGDAYAAVATAAGKAPAVGADDIEPGTLEAALCATPGPARTALTRDLRALRQPFHPHSPNPRYFPLTPEHLSDFDAIVTFDAANPQRVDE